MSKTMMTDAQVVVIARKIDRLNAQIRALVAQIAAGGHPNAQALVEWLRANAFDNPAWATHCVSHHLAHRRGMGDRLLRG